MFEQLKKNTVDSAGQLGKNPQVRFYNPNGKGKRVMFVGNSITFHNIKEDIGWFRACGMAASSEEKDYVHLLMSKISEKDSDASFCVCQLAEWEGNYKNGEQHLPEYLEAREFGADIIVARFIENCPAKDFDGEIFKTEYKKLIKYLDGLGSAKIVFTDGFWHHPGDKCIEEIAKEMNGYFVELGDLGEQDEMKAIGLFEHSGVASHPGDKGMEKIAERIWEKIEKI